MRILFLSCSPYCALAWVLAAPSLWAASFLQNPSFESNYNPTFPHYGTIDLWSPTGGTGVNESGGPFHNTPTQIPDQARVAFLQGNCTIRQSISGLAAGQPHWIQFFYDARNCCGGTIDLVVRFNGTQLDRINNVRPTPTLPNRTTYYFRNVVFTPESDTGELLFETVAAGDATIVLDAITIVARASNEVLLMNPSFEASGPVTAPGYIPAGQNLAGWTSQGGVGINASGAGPFADNGTASDQDQVVFLQGVSSISQVVLGLVQGSNYAVSFGYNARAFNTPHLRVTAGTDVLFDADVTEVGGVDPYHTRTANFTASATTVMLMFEQTAEGDQTVLVDNVRIVGSTRPPLPCLGIAPTSAELAPGQTLTVTVTVPAERIAADTATIRFRSPNPAVAELLGADVDGIVSLFFDIGGETSQTFEVRGVGRGTARIEIVDAAGLCTDNDTSVTVVNSFVRNSSFESSAVPAGVGYGSIVAWNGGSGLNNASGPFHDNGTIPDRRQVAFLQQSATLSQQIFGLTLGQSYWLQFRYNARNCCGGTIDLAVRFAGTLLVGLTNVVPVGPGQGYYFQNTPFVATAPSGLLEFTTTASGDATLLLDAVSIVQRDPGNVVIQNPSFEATGVPSGVGYIHPDPFAGWGGGGGGYGPNITGVGPFTDNGSAPDQDLVAFLQNNGCFISQNISGFTLNQLYTLTYAVNARACCGPEPSRYTVSFAGAILVDEEIMPVGGANPYLAKYVLFTPTTSEGELRFQHTTPVGDHTLLLDNIMVLVGDQRPRPRLRARRLPEKLLRISWPAEATEYMLQCTTGDIASGPWAPVQLIVQVEGDENLVIDETLEGHKFYRLFKPPQ